MPAPAEQIPSPEDFFASEGGGRGFCLICASPIRPDIERSIANGVSRRSLARWAEKFHPEEKGITKDTLARHFERRHHEQSGNA